MENHLEEIHNLRSSADLIIRGTDAVLDEVRSSGLCAGSVVFDRHFRCAVMKLSDSDIGMVKNLGDTLLSASPARTNGRF